MNYQLLKREVCNKWLIDYVEPLYNLHSALQQIALKIFKIIPQRKIHHCQDLESALKLLEKWKLLSEDRLEILIDFSDLLQGPTEYIKTELQKNNSRYETVSYCNCYDSYYTNPQCRSFENSFDVPNHIRVSKYEPVNLYLSENMGPNQSWIDLGRILPGMRNRTEELRTDSGLRQKDKIIKLLEEFECTFEGENPVQIILQSLEKRHLRRQSDYIKENFSFLL